MQKPFKFRYASEMAGGLVLVAALLFTVGIFVAGRAKGWFEGTFEVTAVFTTEEGSFGLKRGNEVMVRNTVAGQVGEILPTESGGMVTRFTIKERFRPFVHADSIAKVRKKFVAAGDAYVEILPGTGSPIQAGAVIRCVKDEEIMETAQGLLKDAQEVVLPMLDEIKEILQHVNGILGSIDEGDGVAGAIVNDKKLTADVKGVVSNLDRLLAESRGAVSDLRRVTGGEEIERTVANLNGLLVESQEALIEAKLLLRGAQRHWLIRRHVERAEAPRLVSRERMREEQGDGVLLRMERAIQDARLENNSPEISKAAYNLAVLMTVRNDLQRARELLQEARMEWGQRGGDATQACILEAAIEQQAGNGKAALHSARRAVELSRDRDVRDETRLEAMVMLGSIQCDGKQLEKFGDVQEDIRRLARKTDDARLKAMASGVFARMASLQGRAGDAARLHDDEAAAYRRDELFINMAGALASAGRRYVEADNALAAADRYFRSGRTLSYAGKPEKAAFFLEKAVKLAKQSKSEYLQKQAETLLKKTVSSPSK